MTAVSLLALAATFMAGKWHERVAHGYIFEIRSEKKYPSKAGQVSLRYATESFGLPFLDPGTSIISLEPHTGLEIVLYKARRGFQEAHPYVENVLVTDDRLEWEDNLNRYELNIAPVAATRTK